jgi:predicted ArsR family transcriptional regulator
MTYEEFEKHRLAEEDDICRNYHGGEEFSVEANESVAPSKAIQRQRILRHLARVGNATSDETEEALGMLHQTASARFSELKRDGWIVPVLNADGKHVSRLTRHGRAAGVYRAKEDAN